MKNSILTIVFVLIALVSFGQKEQGKNLSALHTQEKAVSVTSIFKGKISVVNSLQILKNESLKEHVSDVPALLLCVEGEVIYETEKGERVQLNSGDYLIIEANVKHAVLAHRTSQLVLVK
jgi:quercetin dioxygenase-like cupin family protein